MIRINELEIGYGDTIAVHAASLEVSEGEICSIIGPSGSGKTSLLMAVAGLIPPKNGEIYIDNHKIPGVDPRIGIVLQRHGLFPWKTVLENVVLGIIGKNQMSLKPMDRMEAEKQAEKYLELLGIPDQRMKYPDELSGGQLQRVAIARTMVREPEVLLLDEGSSALDEITRERLQDLILDIQSSRSLTVIAVTHSISEAVYLGDFVAVMTKGHIHQIIRTAQTPRSRTSRDFYAMNTQVREALNQAEKSSV